MLFIYYLLLVVRVLILILITILRCGNLKINIQSIYKVISYKLWKSVLELAEFWYCAGWWKRKWLVFIKYEN